jgi:hypothetical protein
MKMTPTQIRQVIREEKAQILNEQQDSAAHWDAINDALTMLLDSGMDPEQLRDELINIADSIGISEELQPNSQTY